MGSLLDSFRRPEYTGENRCWPCTITNGVVLGIVAGIALLRGRRRTAAAIVAGGLAAIGLRGYLIPYTPQFAPRLVSKLPVDVFDHDTTERPSGSLSDAGEDVSPNSDSYAEGESPPSGEEVFQALHEAGVIVSEGEDIELDSDFRADWRREMQALRERDLEGLAAVADELTPSTVNARAERETTDSGIVLEPQTGTPTFIRRGFAIPEIAATRVLEGRVDSEIARAAGRPLRSLLGRCPLCDEELIVTKTQCCGETTPLGQTPSEKLICRSCNERFFTYD